MSPLATILVFGVQGPEKREGITPTLAIREGDLPTSMLGIGFGPEAALGVVGLAMGLGTFASTAIGSGLSIRRPLRIQTVGFVVVAAAGVLAVVRFTLPAVALFGLALAVSSGLAKLAVDASIQERVPETVRASAFAHAETLRTDRDLESWIPRAYADRGPLCAVVKVSADALPIVVPPRDGTLLKHRFRTRVLGEGAS